MSRTGRVTAVLLSSRTLMLLALGAAAAAGVAFLGGGGGHTVLAQFTDADGLVSGNEIRVAGLQTGGTVDSVQISTNDGGRQVAMVTLNIDDDHWPLRKGTTFDVRPKGVLSNVYVSLNPGPASAPAVDAGHVFTTKETTSPIQLDAFSNLFNADVRESIRTQIQEGVVAFGGTGAANTNGLLHNANPLTADLSPLTAVLAQRSPELDRLNGEFDTITAELASEDSNLRGLIENGNTFLHTIAANAQAVQGTLVHAAGTLTSLDQALSGEENNLKAIFQKGPSSLDSSAHLADMTNPVLAYVNPHIPNLDTLLSYFLSATGLETPSNGQPVINSRIDATLYMGNQRYAVACGGQQWQGSGGPNNFGAGCNGKQLPAPDAGTAAPSSSSTSTGVTGSSSSGAASGAQQQQHAVVQLFGGLFQ